ncbi:cysteine protease atg4 [Aspergillus karnatakaensis]|uniref:cysteine protease ATG4 n=1 Tax=Aspergillus karnatakaensis TaxID=1810916 RepID=UPI003CCD0CD9
MNTSDIERCRKRIIQYIWDPEPQNDQEPELSIWCLGIEYPPLNPSSKEPDNNSPQARTTSAIPPTWPETFLLDFESRIWMTYRSHFPPIQRDTGTGVGTTPLTLSVRLRNQLMDPQGFTSDTGWGCMIRSGQSLLANAMVILSMGRNWRRRDESEQEIPILQLFADSPDAPFSIHNFVKHGAEFCGKQPGEWFGPSAAARCIQGLSVAHTHLTPRVYITNDNSDVFEEKFMKASRNQQGVVLPTLILLGLRLGIDHVTPAYREGLKAVLQFPQSVGIAGGRPSASHYFIGFQGAHFFYLDPHTTQPTIAHKSGDLFPKEEVDTYHTRRLRRLHVQDMDPSMLIGFLIKDEEDWKNWKTRVAATAVKSIINVISETDIIAWQGREEALDEVEAFDDTD